MKIGTSEIIKNIDKYCIENMGIPGIVLMENAAIKVIKNIPLEKFNNFVVVCGRGNNGGDGFAVCRHLYSLGKKVDVFLIGEEKNMSKDCYINYSILKNMGLKIHTISNIEDINDLRETLKRSHMTIDSIFGTGLNNKVKDIYSTVISVMNENSSYILSIDIPSGLDSNNGNVLGNCIRANKTVTFQLYKRGFLNYEIHNLLGEVIVEDIGIPEHIEDKFHQKEFILDEDMIKNKIAIRDRHSHKGDYGRVAIVAGTKGYTGAAYICTEGAVRSGAGLVTLCTRENILQSLTSKVSEAMLISIEDEEEFNKIIRKSNSIAIGPGMGNSDDTFKILSNVMGNADCPVVIDADGLNVLKNNMNILKEKKSNLILTPHLGEMSRLVDKPIDYIKKNRIEIAKDFAEKYGVVLLLKGYHTFITDGESLIVNSTGNSAMASGGMGDCLTGIIASLLAQGYNPLRAAALGAYIHGYCGDALSKKMFCVNASHILKYLPYGMKEIQNL
ncbi:NAD(P)H-hydrate dehydratase [uncultured Clostridium sp.]|uniref:NAD(P)H-hydrate dehydratase n=1 Tax=uncultured Clostridium sp. TaxID=59620 RepID=UPI0028E73960|nr:NAD(P)H-hydrate dehydratase [uncultured Clostridium sp.]